MLKGSLSKLRQANSCSLNSNLSSKFSSAPVYSNIKCLDEVEINGKTINYDNLIHEYSKIIKAFLQRRWTSKEEIWPKAYILNDLPAMQDSTKAQSPYPVDQLRQILLTEEELEKMFKANNVNSFYLNSAHLEDHQKPFLDQVLRKQVMNGDEVPMENLEENEQRKQELHDLYNKFYNSDTLTDFEEFLMNSYLEKKQQKYKKFLTAERAIYRCRWGEEDQRLLEQMHNYQNSDFEFYANFKPIFKPMSVQMNIENYNIIKRINNYEEQSFGFLRNIMFDYMSSQDKKVSEDYISDWARNVFARIQQHVDSIEFTHMLNLPPDFHIEYAILCQHYWLVTAALQKYAKGNLEVEEMLKCLKVEFDEHTKRRVGVIHLKKKQDFIRDLASFWRMNQNLYNRHFFDDIKTSQNPYYKVDALVWSAVFYEKVDRYSDEVLMYASYFLRNFDYFMRLSLDDLLTGTYDWDVHRVDLDYKEKIFKVNPPLNEREFEQELLSDEPVKKFFYEYDDPDYKVPINEEKSNLIDRRFYKIEAKLVYMINKFENLSSYDYYNDREEKEEETQKKESKYAWKPRKEISDDLNLMANDVKFAEFRRELRLKREAIDDLA